MPCSNRHDMNPYRNFPCPPPCPEPWFCPQPCPCPPFPPFPPIPPIPPQAESIAVQYQIRDTMVIENDETIFFDYPIKQDPQHIFYDSFTGEFFLDSEGTYYLSWRLNVNSASATDITIALLKNGSTYADFDIASGRQQISGSAIITADEDITAIKLVNRSDAAIYLDTTLGELASQGDIVIFKI